MRNKQNVAQMNVEIISIGDELLIGQVVNTNAAWMAEKLYTNGFITTHIKSIRDNSKAITDALENSMKNADVIIITGGLGPTKDDITKTTLKDFFNTSIIFDKHAYSLINRFFEERGIKMTETNRKQAEILANCTPVYNKNGTASGMWIEEKGKVIVSLPGVPFEMQTMMQEDIIPRLKEAFHPAPAIYKTILTTGVGESFLADMIEDWENNLPGNFKLAYLPSPGIVRLRISAIGGEPIKLKTSMNQEVEKLQQLIPEFIFGFDDDKLEGIVGEMLKEKNQTLSTAESCTGGYIGHLITGISGSSGYFQGSIVSYSNRAKMELLDVAGKDIEQYGAVSETVAIQMAEGARKKLHTGYSIATTGIAGPTGGTPGKPVGTTWIAVSTPNGTFAKKYHFGNHRQRNIRQTALAGLNMLRLQLKEF